MPHHQSYQKQNREVEEARIVVISTGRAQQGAPGFVNSANSTQRTRVPISEFNLISHFRSLDLLPKALLSARRRPLPIYHHPRSTSGIERNTYWTSKIRSAPDLWSSEAELPERWSWSPSDVSSRSADSPSSFPFRSCFSRIGLTGVLEVILQTRRK